MSTRCDEYRLLGRSGLRVSPLCLGTMTFGEEWGYGSPAAECRRIYDAYRDAGGNFIDTANYYTNGTSEALLGEFSQGHRDEIVLGTKFTLNMRPGDPNAGGNQRKNIVCSLEASLRRLRTDYVDLYWLHVWEERTPIDEVMRALDDLVRAGKVLYIGVSDTPAWRVAQGNTLAELRGWSPFIALQVLYNLVDRTAEREFLPMACALGLGATPWSPLAAGILTGKYGGSAEPDTKRKLSPEKLSERNLSIARVVSEVAREVDRTPSQVALRWLLERPGVVSPIIGARTARQLEENLKCLSVELDDVQRKRLDEVSRVELGFPHDFLGSQLMRERITGGTKVRDRETRGSIT